jgi:murein DD-endopeptidase MepM/ murein hydrolase activator NlpD
MVLLLGSCTPLQTTTPTLPSTSTIIPFIRQTSTLTPTFVPPTITNTPRPTITSTSTSVPCDPHVVDFCITDWQFILQRPFFPPANDSVERTYPFASTANGTRDPHHGVEFENELGTPVHAAGDGVVLFAGSDDVAIYSPWKNYYGNLVVIGHDDGLSTLYAHLSRLDVTTGQTVQGGDKIGEVGQSGVAIGSHLHFEVRRGDPADFFSSVNPEVWLMPIGQDLGTIALTVQNNNGEYQQARITLQRYTAVDQLVATYYVDTYHPSLTLGDENAGMGDLPSGRYRLTILLNGRLYERWVEVESGKLTQVVIVVE